MNIQVRYSFSDKKGGRQPKNSEPVQENDFPSILEAAGISRGNSDPVLLKSTRGIRFCLSFCSKLFL